MVSVDQHKKYLCLKQRFRSLGRAAVAFSGGVDSTFLLYAAKDALGEENVLALTVEAAFCISGEIEEAKEYCRTLGVRQEILSVDPEQIPYFTENPADRCYHCKKVLFEQLLDRACELGFFHLAEGANLDDEKDYRPGRKAVKELSIRSPLADAGFTKNDIRELSRFYGIPTADKPSCACLASRFPYGERITKTKLQMVGKAEQVLQEHFDLRGHRVRIHEAGDAFMARLEVSEDDYSILLQAEVREKILAALQDIGFTFVTLDLKPYQTGSMNKMLKGVK